MREDFRPLYDMGEPLQETLPVRLRHQIGHVVEERPGGVPLDTCTLSPARCVSTTTQVLIG